MLENVLLFYVHMRILIDNTLQHIYIQCINIMLYTSLILC